MEIIAEFCGNIGNTILMKSQDFRILPYFFQNGIAHMIVAFQRKNSAIYKIVSELRRLREKISSFFFIEVIISRRKCGNEIQNRGRCLFDFFFALETPADVSVYRVTEFKNTRGTQLEIFGIFRQEKLKQLVPDECRFFRDFGKGDQSIQRSVHRGIEKRSHTGECQTQHRRKIRSVRVPVFLEIR